MGDERHSDFVQERRRFLGVPMDTPRGSVPVVNSQETGETGIGPARAPDLQREQLERVSNRTRGSILAFFALRAVGTEFHADELRRHVAGQCGLVAPGSPDRILRALRKCGAVNYRVINRAQSLYRITPLGET